MNSFRNAGAFVAPTWIKCCKLGVGSELSSANPTLNAYARVYVSGGSEWPLSEICLGALRALLKHRNPLMIIT